MKMTQDKTVYQYTRIFFAMALILLHNQFVNDSIIRVNNPVNALQWLPAFIGYFLLIIDAKDIAPRPWNIILMLLLLLGGVGNIIGFVTLLGGSLVGALPVVNLLGHVGAVCFLALWTRRGTQSLEEVSGLPWLAASILLLLFDAWLIGYTCMDIGLYSGVMLRLIPSVIMLVALYDLHMRIVMTNH